MGWPSLEAASPVSAPLSAAPAQDGRVSPGSRKVVLVAMLISCRCSSVSVWKRRMEEPEEKAIQTPLPAFTMCVTLTASSWCASKLCCSTEAAPSVTGRLAEPLGAKLTQPLNEVRGRGPQEPRAKLTHLHPKPSQREGTSGAAPRCAGKHLTTGGVPPGMLCLLIPGESILLRWPSSSYPRDSTEGGTGKDTHTPGSTETRAKGRAASLRRGRGGLRALSNGTEAQKEEAF